MIKEITVQKAISTCIEPDGFEEKIFDAYDGCDIGCPYCYQWSDPTWNKDILVKTNVISVLQAELAHWDKNEIFYFGDRGDPYLDIEEKYGLTRKCLELTNQANIPTIVITKSFNGIVLRDIDIFTHYSNDFVLILGLANLKELKDNALMKGINLANQLFREGVNLHVFVTPILPGIINIESIADLLDERIKISLDKFWMDPKSTHALKMLQYIKENYPDLYPEYEEIINQNKNEYFEYLWKKYSGSKRITFLRDEQGNGITRIL